jgi:hypothetical protein
LLHNDMPASIITDDSAGLLSACILRPRCDRATADTASRLCLNISAITHAMLTPFHSTPLHQQVKLPSQQGPAAGAVIIRVHGPRSGKTTTQHSAAIQLPHTTPLLREWQRVWMTLCEYDYD